MRKQEETGARQSLLYYRLAERFQVSHVSMDSAQSIFRRMKIWRDVPLNWFPWYSEQIDREPHYAVIHHTWLCVITDTASRIAGTVLGDENPPAGPRLVGFILSVKVKLVVIWKPEAEMTAVVKLE